MITVICTNTNEKITLTKEITHSGEAKIWQTSRSGYLAKIYHNPTEQRSKKLEVMIAHPPQEPNQHLGHISFAWPESILKDEQGKNIGFLMPEVEGGKELPKIYNPSLRKKQNLKVDWQFLYVMARNIAALVGELHRAGYVIGDMKPQNILVNERARASIIDTDSFQVKNPLTGEIYHCLVGTEGYTPPELIEKEIADIEQTEIHDRYRLGIIIYEIIFSGNKVFQGKWEGEGEQPQISKLIRQGIWIYQPNSQMKSVGRTITLDIINSELKECFLRCFNEGNKNPKLRPRAIEWLSALEIGMNQLLECEKIEGHYYNSSYGSCYWCERARDLGVDIFPGIERVKPIISKKPEEKYNQEEYDPVIIADHNSGKATNITKIPTVGNINKIRNIINKPRRGFLKTAGIATKTNRRSKSGRWLLFVIGMGGIAVLSGLAGALLAVSDSTPLQQANLTSEQEAVFGRNRISGNGSQFSQLTRPVNILVMGMSVLPPDIQNPPDHTKNLGYLPQLNSFDGLSDVMLLLKFDPQTKKIVMLSIPRDTRTEIEGIGTQKINSANVNGGPALTAKTVSNLLGGVVIDRYIRINVLGVGKLIDALGGITVYVPKDMKYQDNSQHLYINLKVGKQHLSGDQALQLLRFRHDALGDIGRIQRQQMVLRALFEQSVNGATLARFPQILETIREHIDTNLSIEELIALVGFGTGTNRSNIEMVMLPGRLNGASYWVPNKQAIEKLAVKNFGLGASWMDTQETIDPSRLRIAIQDSTGEGQSVRGLINTLQQAGYRNVSRVSRAAGEPLETTHIVAQQGDSNSAESVRELLGFGEVRVESTGDIGSDITIQVGRDWLRKSQ